MFVVMLFAFLGSWVSRASRAGPKPYRSARPGCAKVNPRGITRLHGSEVDGRSGTLLTYADGPAPKVASKRDTPGVCRA